uniref:NADH dehydrogenase subunit 4L n=1 Tax=Pliciphaedusa aenea TaxID=1885823 RepID=A0A224A1E7_9EUPU|nr:NADH dehydrogenase subunit 4L [Pliciphaedusa aenea]
MPFLFTLYSLLLLLFMLFFYTQKHYLSSLLILEAMVLISLLLNGIVLCLAMNNMTSLVVLLTLAVCEAGLGLSLLMSFLKTSSSDYISFGGQS